MASGSQTNLNVSSTSSSPIITSTTINSPNKASQVNTSSMTPNPPSTSSNPTKQSRSKPKSSAPNSKSSSNSSSPTTSSGNVLPKGLPSGPDAPPQICSNCQTTSTPLWRRDGKGGLCCNSCQLWAKTKGYPRPMSLKTDVIKPRIRQSKSGPKKKTKKQLALEAANGGEDITNSPSVNKKAGASKKDGLMSSETSPDPTNDRESSPSSSRSYSRSYSGSESPPPSNSGRGSIDSYHLSHSQHLPTPPSGLQHSIHSSNGGVNLPSLSRLLAETGQQPQQSGHQSAPPSHRPSLDGSSSGNWSPPIGDAEQEAAYALASRRAGKLPEGAYVSHYPHPPQHALSRRGSVPSLFGTSGVGQQSSNVRGGGSGSASASASGESSSRSSSHTRSEDVSDHYSNLTVSGRPLPPLKRERDTDTDLKSASGVNIPASHHSTSSLRASSLAEDRDRRGRMGSDGEALRFGVSPRSRADVDANFARGRPYSSLRDSETNPLFNHTRYSPAGPGAMPGGIGMSSHHSQSLERPPGVTTGPPSTSGSRSHSQVPPSLGNVEHYNGQAAPAARSSSAGRAPINSSASRASSLSRIDSSSNHSSPRGSPFASPRGSPSRNLEPLPLPHINHPQLNHQHPHSYHPYASPNHSPLLNARDGLSGGSHNSHLPPSMLAPQNQVSNQPQHSAAAALDVLGAAASERLIDEGLTSRSTVNNYPGIISISNTSSPLNPNVNVNGPNQQPSNSRSSSPRRPHENEFSRGRTSERGGGGIGPAQAAQESAIYFARRANAEGPAFCSYHKNHHKNSSDDPTDSMELDDSPAFGSQPQLRYLDCGCSPDEALFEMACERKGIKGLDPRSRRNLLSLERKINGYKEGDWDDC